VGEETCKVCVIGMSPEFKFVLNFSKTRRF